jgi:hypothetical protein
MLLLVEKDDKIGNGDDRVHNEKLDGNRYMTRCLRLGDTYGERKYERDSLDNKCDHNQRLCVKLVLVALKFKGKNYLALLLI